MSPSTILVAVEDGRLLEVEGCDPSGPAPFAPACRLDESLLAPTRIYVKPLLNLIRDFEVHGMVHVTGGGFDPFDH